MTYLCFLSDQQRGKVSRRSAAQSEEGCLKAPSPGNQSRKTLARAMSWHGAPPRCLQRSPSSPTNEQSCSQRGSAGRPGSLPAPKLLLSSCRGEEQQPRVESWHRHGGKERAKNVYSFSLVQGTTKTSPSVLHQHPSTRNQGNDCQCKGEQG